MLKKIVLSWVIFLMVFITSCGEAELKHDDEIQDWQQGNKVELKHDDGTSDGRQGFGGSGTGIAVEFSPSSPITINAIRVSGQLVGFGYEKRMINFLILDKERKKLYSISVPHALFTSSSGWVDVKIPGLVVSDNFYVVTIPNTPKNGGVYLNYDSSGNKNNGYATMVRGGVITDEWQLHVPQKKFTPMIRVEGTVQ